MRQTQRLIGLLAAGIALAVPAEALAFSAGQTFSNSPTLGGGGGIFYLGRPSERGWDCTLCHLGAPKKVRARLQSEPDMFTTLHYEPGVTYTVTVAMEIADGGSELGIGAPGNINEFSASFEDPAGQDAGVTVGVSAIWSVTGNAKITSNGTNHGETSWKFTWFAPDGTMAVAGPVTIYFAIVDGNGGDAQDVFNDPLGDDVLVSHVTLTPGGAMATRDPSAAEETAEARPAPSRGETPIAAAAAVACAAALFGAAKRRRRTDA